MPLNKIQYTDDVTVIPADNLNNIQDSIIDLEEDGGGSVPTNVRQAMLTLFESAAYAETGLTDEIAVVQSWASEVTEISLSATTLSLNGDTPQTIVATTVPSGSAVVWSTSDSTIATVTGGVVTGVSNGTCRITASAGDKSATCAVTVTGFAELVSISAVYTQSGTVYDTDSLDDLKTDLVVTATYSDSSTAVITDYVLSGTLAEGTNTITVTYGGKATTFDVTVSTSPIPEGYTKYDYLYSDATASTNGSYINTGITMGTLTSLKITTVCQCDGTLSSQEYVAGIRQNGTSNSLGVAVGINATHDEFLCYTGATASEPTTTPTGKHTLIGTWMSNSATIQVDDSTPVQVSGTSRAITNLPLCFFGLKHYANAEGGTPYFFRGKLYYAEAEKDGTIITKCYPCVRDSDGQVGMYDIVNQAFYTPYSYSGRSIVAGNDA